MSLDYMWVKKDVRVVLELDYVYWHVEDELEVSF